MFTGLIETLGVVDKISKTGAIKLAVSAKLSHVKLGDSIAVNGVCLTAEKILKNVFQFSIMAETWNNTALKYLQQGNSVNLERSLALGDRLGGHFVSGHVDVAGEIARIEKKPNLYLITVDYPAAYSKYVIEKGSIAINGISLTVQRKGKSWLQVGIIPHTLEQTDLRGHKAKDKVNLEFDLLGKYVENLLESRQKATSGRLKKYLQS